MYLADLVEHYEFSLSCIRRIEIELDAKAMNSTPFTKIEAAQLEKSVAQLFTLEIFKKGEVADQQGVWLVGN
jgi:zinc finger SWIM domain-containing protein 3